MYCSADCEQLAAQAALERLFAELDGEEPPSMKEIADRRQRAKRWTPETMQERIDELQSITHL